MKNQLSLLFLAALPIVSVASPILDGGVIQNSRSTNTAAYTIKVWSDGHALLSRQGSADKPVTVGASLAQAFLADAKSSRANPGTAGHCMKSASFGTTTTVVWHEWTSVDLQCPPLSSAVSALARDTRAIQGASNVGVPLRSMPLPVEQRKLPVPSMSPSPESEHPRP